MQLASGGREAARVLWQADPQRTGLDHAPERGRCYQRLAVDPGVDEIAGIHFERSRLPGDEAGETVGAAGGDRGEERRIGRPFRQLQGNHAKSAGVETRTTGERMKGAAVAVVGDLDEVRASVPLPRRIREASRATGFVA